MMQRLTIIDVIPTPVDGIISALEEFNVPWKNNTYYVPSDLDSGYLAQYPQPLGTLYLDSSLCIC